MNRDSILLTIPEACELLRIKRSLLYLLIRADKLATIKIGRCVRIHRSEVERIVQNGASFS